MYLDRVCISILGAYVPEDLGLTGQQWASALSIFFLAYALGQVPAGTLSDRFGPRTMLTIYVLLWSACTIWTGLVTSSLALLAARLACGLSQAGAYPTSGVLLKRWIPLAERGRASSFVSLGGRVGGALAPVLTAVCVVALTPADVSTSIAPRDLLRPEQISKLLLGQGGKDSSELAAKIGEHLTDSAREATQRLAKAEAPSSKAAGSESPDRSPADQADVDQLASFLDSATTAPWLSDHLAVETLGLPGEASDILKLNRSDRSARQLAKLHRLALEAAFPGSLRQVYTPAWRRVLWLYGGIGLAVAAVFWCVVRDQPPQISTSAASLGLPTETDPTTGARIAEQPAPLKPRPNPFALVKLLGGSLSLWLFGYTQFGVNVGWAFLITLLPDYLTDLHVPLDQRGLMQTVMISVGCLGMVAGGFLSDSLVRWIGLRWARAADRPDPVCRLGIGGQRLLGAVGLGGGCSAVSHGRYGGLRRAIHLGVRPRHGRAARRGGSRLWQHVRQPGGRGVAPVAQTDQRVSWLERGIRHLRGQLCAGRTRGLVPECHASDRDEQSGLVPGLEDCQSPGRSVD